MAVSFPCELINWLVLPSVRRELAMYFVREKGLKRRQIAGLLGLTEAAVCQYVKAKRGKRFSFPKDYIEKIHKIGDAMLKAKKSPHQTFISRTCVFCREIRNKLLLCSMHKKGQAGKTFSGCVICLGGK